MRLSPLEDGRMYLAVPRLGLAASLGTSVGPPLRTSLGWQPRCPNKLCNVQCFMCNVTDIPHYTSHITQFLRAGGFAPDPLRSFALFQPLDLHDVLQQAHDTAGSGNASSNQSS